MGIKHELKKLLWKFGYDICRPDPATYTLARRRRILESYNINTVLDVGANTGQFARHMRNELGFAGRIVSFEPLSSAFDVLKQKANGDSKWEVLHFALGDVETSSKINIAGNSMSSSLLDMLTSHIEAVPQSKYVGTEMVEIKTLDSIFGSLCSEEDNIYLKIDTQGFESKVIGGAGNSLAHINTIELEMSLVPLYQDELLFTEMYGLLKEKGYELISIEAVYFDRIPGRILQVDGVFHRF